MSVRKLIQLFIRSFGFDGSGWLATQPFPWFPQSNGRFTKSTYHFSRLGVKFTEPNRKLYENLQIECP